MRNEDAESADFDIDILFKESKMQKGNKEQEKDLSPLSPVRETKIVEVMSELTSEQSTSTAVMTPMMKTEKMDSRRQSSCVIQIDRVRSATIKVPISINGQVTKAVLDTGAEVTVLNSSLYFGIPEEKRPILKKATRNLVVAEAGKSMETHGIAMMNMNLTLQTINSKKGIHVDGKWIECYTERKVDDKIARVVLTENVTVPANSEKILFGGSYNTDAIDTRYTMLKSVVEDNRKIMVTQILVDPFEKVIPFRLVNMEDHPVQLNLKMNINLTDEPVRIPDEWNSTIRNCKAENSWEMNDKCRNEAEIPALPDHLYDLFERSSKNIANEVTKRKLADMLLKNSKAFACSKTDVGTCSFIKHRIDTAGAAPVRQPLRRTPIRFENEKFENLQDQLKTGVIKPSKSAWVSPVVLVRKKDNSVRWCVDFRRVNNLTIKDAYPIPRIVMCLDCLSSASIFLCLDLQSGYWQLMVEESDQPKTAFITKYGLYEYTKMPFGFCNAPSTFQRYMKLIFRGLQWQTLQIYLDDIIIFSSDEEEHLKRLDEVFSRLINAGLKLKPSKCDLLREEILYLGHVVGKEGIKPNPKIVQSVDSWKAPSTAKEIQQFFVLCNYYRQYMYKFSDIAAPLSQLTRKDVPFEWTQPCQESFEKLKIALTTSPILAYPQSDGMFILDTDASNIGIGAVLSQIQENKEKVISYASKKLDRVQQRYSVTRRELLAVVTFIQQFILF
ncbi:Transposon Ty3-I Gag-Pol polyprotein,Transposon Ty3-G Gag-Pol polyprotein,Retrovirus-related Pol polyprotein from transposon 297 [Mytilus edulis]|uniref:Transposon Ty3-I Gag-Pol polyprotein,Transposon Ty3-G Gag-Pol polyprotein,Retrovirus-related Pol polyprotein from transposon 297 n=1 Tax=Mytilus edulis TaxID=6550 RepID=A0A8S3QVG1_MYTED|nr:Transposon Ty3-I Gag-Pol polyprotein,Transposon Ty3-G Gag-Pol polyprotein,Retrovirus-related Pol polyprotein from transposon 297 [Mytilus edulis]